MSERVTIKMLKTAISPTDSFIVGKTYSVPREKAEEFESDRACVVIDGSGEVGGAQASTRRERAVGGRRTTRGE